LARFAARSRSIRSAVLTFLRVHNKLERSHNQQLTFCNVSLLCCITMLRKRTVFAFLALVTFPIARSLADVRGKVVDDNGAPVAGINVYGPNNEAPVISDDAGQFTVSGSPSVLTLIGDDYEPAVVDVTGKSAVTITLTTAIGSSSEVIEIKSNARPPAVPGATQLQRAEITKIPGARGDVLSGIKNLPGVANNGSLTPFSAGLIIRGASPEDSRILIDGFEVPVLYHFLGVQSVLPSEMVDDIDYQPGTFGVSQGRASGGLIEVKSRKGDDVLNGFAELSFVNVAGLVQGPIGKRGRFAVAARRSVIDAVLKLAIPDDAPVSFTAYPRYYDYQAKLDYDASNAWELSAFAFGSSDKVELLTDGDNAADPVAAGGLSNSTSFTRVIASAKYREGRFRHVTGVSAYTDTNHFTVGPERYLLLDRDGVALRTESTWNRNKFQVTIGAEADVTRNKFNILFTRPPKEGDPRGPNFSQDALLMTTGKAVATDVAAWSSATVFPLPELEITAGLRGDAFIRNERALVQPRGQIIWRVADGSTLRAAAGLYSRPAENLDEQLQKVIAPERAWQTSAGAEQRLAPGVTIAATGFYNRLSDLLVLSADRRDQMSLGGYDTIGTGTTYGIEFLLKGKTKNAFGWLAYTGSRAKRSDGPGQLTRLFDYDQSHNLIAVGSLKLGKAWQLGSRFQLTTGKPATPVVGALYQSDVDLYLPTYGQLNSQRVKTQHQLDLRVDRVWQLRGWKVSGYLDVSNVYFNAAEIDAAYNFDYSAKTPITNLPILPSFGVRGEF
jgi:hypothetical protein